MLRRSFGGNDGALPTHGGGNGVGFSSPSNSNGNDRGYGGYGGYSHSGNQSYGGYSGGNGTSYSSSSSGMYGETSKYSKKKRKGSGGFIGSPLVIAAVALGVINLILTGLWLSSRGRYRSLLKGLNASTSRAAIEKVQWTENEVIKERNEVDRQKRKTEARYSSRIKELEQQSKEFIRERDDLREKYESPDQLRMASRLKKREPAYLEQIGRMQQAIRKESKRTVLERYDPKIHLL